MVVHERTAPTGTRLFERVVVVVDGTDAGAEACRQAARLVEPDGSVTAVHDPERASLDAVLRDTGATVVVVPSHGERRLVELLLGGAGELVHRAPCSVLVARRPVTPTRFPLSIAVGIDGSLSADAALAAAQVLAERFDARLRTVVALGGNGVDLAHVHLRTPFAEEVDAAPVDALLEAAGSADLLVVGSRGLRGIRALGSVSERVAHRAPASVLVVRG